MAIGVVRRNPRFFRLVYSSSIGAGRRKTVVSDITRLEAKTTIHREQDIHGKPYRIGAIAGNISLGVNRQNFLGFQRTTPVRSVAAARMILIGSLDPA